MTTEERIAEAKSDLGIVHPFFAYYLLALPTRVVQGARGAAFTDGTAIYYDRHRTESWTVENFMFVECHEVMHVVLGHTGSIWEDWVYSWRDIIKRVYGFDDDHALEVADTLIQHSADHVINLMLSEYYASPNFRHNRRPVAPSTPHCNPVYKGLSVPEVSELLFKEWQRPRNPGSGGAGTIPNLDFQTDPEKRPESSSDEGKEEPAPPDPIEWGLCDSFGVAQAEFFPEEEIVIRSWPDEIIIARRCEESLRAQGVGTILMSDLVMAAMPKPVIPWQSLLRAFVSASTASELDWYHPDRRFVSEGFYLPDDGDQDYLEGVFVRDTSGSVSDEDFARFTSEILNTARHYPWGKIHLLDVTDTIVHTQLTKSTKEVELVRYAQGGTSFVPPFIWLAEKRIRPKFLLYFTDGYGTFPAKPGFPVLWLNCSGKRDHYPAWAKVIEIK